MGVKETVVFRATQRVTNRVTLPVCVAASYRALTRTREAQGIGQFHRDEGAEFQRPSSCSPACLLRLYTATQN